MKIRILDTPGARLKMQKAYIHPKVIDCIAGLTLEAHDQAGKLAVTVNGKEWTLPAEVFQVIEEATP